jgi:hypothetical protein
LRLYRISGGLRLEFARTGKFDILSEGRLIRWTPGSQAIPEVVRAVLLGPVMALALHESGILCLHGSAVAFDDRAVAFVAPKMSGKSTLALALVADGAVLLSDDLVAIDHRRPPMVLPGVHSVRVHEDVTALFESRIWGDQKEGKKNTLIGFPEERVGWSPIPLAVIYILEFAEPQPGAPSVARTALAPVESAALVAQRTKLGSDLVGGEIAGVLLRWVIGVTSLVPVQRLTVVRDLGKLPEVVRCLSAWHGH